MPYLYLFLFSSVAVLIYISGDLGLRAHTTGQTQNISIIPTIPVIPVIFTLSAYGLNQVIAPYGIPVAYLPAVMLLVYGVVLHIYVYRNLH